MIAEWISEEQYLLARLGGVVSDTALWICCLCLQDTPMLETWTVTGMGDETFTFCSDCRTTYADEPIRAHLEAKEWIEQIREGRSP